MNILDWVVFILIFPLTGIFVFGGIGKMIDKKVYSVFDRNSVLDPLKINANYTFRHLFLLLYASLLLGGYIFYVIFFEKDNAPPFSQIFLYPAFYICWAISFLIIFFTLYLFFRYQKNKKRLLEKDIQEKLIKLGFFIENGELRATKEELSVEYDSLGNLTIGLFNPTNKSASLSLGDKYELYNELGSFLQEKIQKLKIPIRITKTRIYFILDNIDQLTEYLSEMREILLQIKKELIARSATKFQFFRDE